MKKLVFLWLVVICFQLAGKNNNISSGYSAKNVISVNDTLCTPNPSREAVALYRYLLDMKGQYILSGQQWVQWGINEINYIYNNTGKKPAIAGFDYINSSQNALENIRAAQYWRDGGIPTIMWHFGAPGIGQGYDNSKMQVQYIDSCFIEGTDEYNDFWNDLEAKANLLEALRDSGVPVLWRPYHELDGGWFWWSKEGPEKFKQLWITMFNYFVHDRGLNNLIWVLCFDREPDASWYPGDEYVDAVGGDTYDGVNSVHMEIYNGSNLVAGDNNYPICYHECGTPPDPDNCIKLGGMWSWWMEWHTDYLSDLNADYLNTVYNHDINITLDEIPDIMEVYNWNDTCASSEITPFMKIVDGDTITANKIAIDEETEFYLKVTSADNGAWSWSGAGLSGNSTEQTFTATGTCVPTVTFLNECGATSTQTFKIVYDGSVSVNELSYRDINVKIYPVPATDLINIEIPLNSDANGCKLNIYSMDGILKINDKMTSNSLSVNISTFEQGMYIIQFEGKNYRGISKFIKSN